MSGKTFATGDLLAVLLDDELKGILSKVKTIAVIGASDRPNRPVDMVGRYLIRAGYTVIPVHPKRKSVWGLRAFASVLDVPEPIDILNLFRASRFIPDHARECAALVPAPKIFWMQEGIRSPEAGSILMGTGVKVVEDLCLSVEHKRLFG